MTFEELTAYIKIRNHFLVMEEIIVNMTNMQHIDEVLRMQYFTLYDSVKEIIKTCNLKIESCT